MRIAITADSVPTEQVRQLAAALSTVGLGGAMTVGCDGPELWKCATPKMAPWQFAQVVARLVTTDGSTPIADVLRP